MDYVYDDMGETMLKPKSIPPQKTIAQPADANDPPNQELWTNSLEATPFCQKLLPVHLVTSIRSGPLFRKETQRLVFNLPTLFLNKSEKERDQMIITEFYSKLSSMIQAYMDEQK
uniref:Uncharacterized protein n=1 Tax=Romanomermis culicivorax TaxID=13658 RepID=A0A915INH7_ROMCU